MPNGGDGNQQRRQKLFGDYVGVLYRQMNPIDFVQQIGTPRIAIQ
jgi:hypothetical protein